MRKEIKLSTSLLNSIIVKKHNALTDGYIPKKGREILPDKLINALMWKYEQEGTKFAVSKTDLRELLSLKSSKDDERIWSALATLATPIQVRDFTFKGREVKRSAVSFLINPKEYKDSEGTIELTISEEMIEVLKQKVGYTPIELKVSNSFRTKYALKLYELYKRYYSLPNKKGEGVGTIAKTLQELNNIFGTNFKHVSDILKGINRGLKEIERNTFVLMTCFFDKRQKVFIFGWQQHDQHPNLRIPFSRIHELIDWYIIHKKPVINNENKYKDSLREKIINDAFGDLDTYWRGMLQAKYGLTQEQIRSKEYYNSKTNKYKNFTRKPQPSLL